MSVKKREFDKFTNSDLYDYLKRNNIDYFFFNKWCELLFKRFFLMDFCEWRFDKNRGWDLCISGEEVVLLFEHVYNTRIFGDDNFKEFNNWWIEYLHPIIIGKDLVWYHLFSRCVVSRINKNVKINRS